MLKMETFNHGNSDWREGNHHGYGSHRGGPAQSHHSHRYPGHSDYNWRPSVHNPTEDWEKYHRGNMAPSGHRLENGYEEGWQEGGMVPEVYSKNRGRGLINHPNRRGHHKWEFRGGGGRYSHGPHPQGGRREFHPQGPPYMRPSYDQRNRPFMDHAIEGGGDNHWNAQPFQQDWEEPREPRRLLDPRSQDSRPQDPRQHRQQQQHIVYQRSPDKMSPRDNKPLYHRSPVDQQSPLPYSPTSSDSTYHNSPLYEKHHVVDGHAHGSHAHTSRSGMDNRGVSSHDHTHSGHPSHPVDARPTQHEVGYPIAAGIPPLLGNNTAPENAPKTEPRPLLSPRMPPRDTLEEMGSSRSFDKHHPVSLIKVSPPVKPQPAHVSCDALQSILWQRVLVEHSYCRRMTSDQTPPTQTEDRPAAYSVLQVSDKNARIILTSTATKKPKMEVQQAKKEGETIKKRESESNGEGQEEEEAYRTSESNCPSNSSGVEDFNLDLDSETESIASADSRVGLKEGLMKVSIPKKYYHQQQHSGVMASRLSPASSVTSTDSITRLRNGRVPTNLYHFASRKGPKRILDPASSTASHQKDDDVIEIPDDNKLSGKLWESTKRETSVQTSCDDFEEDNVIKLDPSSDDDSLMEEPPTKRRRRRSFYYASKHKLKTSRTYKMCRSQSKETSCSSRSNDSTPTNFEVKQKLRQQQKKGFKDFVPIVLSTRSRAETMTTIRRDKMKEEMNEQERLATPQPGEDRRLRKRGSRSTTHSSPLHSLDDSVSLISDISTVGSTSRDHDSSMESSAKFSPELIIKCRKVLQMKSIGSGDSALHKVSRKGRYEMAKYFILAERIPVNLQDNAGWTPLHEACNNAHCDVVELLLQHNADPNIAAHDGTRPIHDAIEAGNTDIVQVLIHYGADPTVEHAEKSPPELARQAGFHELASYLDVVIEERMKRLAVVQKSVTTSVPVKKRGSKARLPTTDSIVLPIDGYSSPLLGPELDYPLLYVSAPIEMSSEPLLPVYNITVAAGANPRRHNFHIFDDVIEKLGWKQEELREVLTTKTYHMKMSDFLQQIRHNPITKHSHILHTLTDKNALIELVPLSNELRQLLSIEVANIDD